MSTRIDQTAIVIFSRTATHEAGVKIFDPVSGKNRNRAIAESLIRRTLATARRSRLPVFFHTTALQNADSFGENFADALEAVFNRGYDRVIAIGNDCPALQADDILQAAQQLETNSLVLGPAADGGAYLIGMRRTAYNRAAFQQINWQTSRVLAQLKIYATGDFVCLSEKSDVDSLADLARVIRTDRLPISLIIELAVFLQRLLPANFCRVYVALPVAFLDCLALRGPPCPANFSAPCA